MQVIVTARCSLNVPIGNAESNVMEVGAKRAACIQPVKRYETMVFGTPDHSNQLQQKQRRQLPGPATSYSIHKIICG